MSCDVVVVFVFDWIKCRMIQPSHRAAAVGEAKYVWVVVVVCVFEQCDVDGNNGGNEFEKVDGGAEAGMCGD